MMTGAKQWLERIHQLPHRGKVKIMNVCGGHERSITMAGLRKKTSQGGAGKLPPTMQYFAEIGKKLADPKAEEFDNNAILLGSPQQIVDRLKEVEAMGIEEVILYFNYGMKPDALVREQMDRFMADIAPAFRGSHGTAELQRTGAA